MKLKCPDCGCPIDFDRLRQERDFWQIIEIIKALTPVEAELITEYVECFRASAHAEMPTKKYLRILREAVVMINAGMFNYDKDTHHVDRALALEAMQKTVNTEKRGFKNHNYWKVIMVGMLKKRGEIEEKQTEDSRREASEKRPKSEPERVPIPGWVKERLNKL